MDYIGVPKGILTPCYRNAGASYVSIVSPRLKLIDERGLEEGVKRGDELLAARVAAQCALGRGYHWVFAQPNGEALRTVAALVESGKVRAHIDQTFALEQIAEAHEYCEAGKARGKIVIDLGLCRAIEG